MNKKIAIVFAVALAMGGQGAALGAEGLSLDDALHKALAGHPQLSAAEAEVRAREGGAIQAGLPPNPELELEVEELGAAGGTDARETTAALSQELELGGKRSRRREVARLEVGLARTDAAALRLDLEAAVKAAFFEALAAQERAALQEELVGIAAESLETVAERVEAGKVSPIQETQAELEMTAARLELRRAWAAWASARSALAATWGGSGDELSSVQGALHELPAVPPEDELVEELAHTSDLVRWDGEIALGEAIEDLERAGRIPNLGVTGGVRTVGSGDETTYLFVVSVPLPLFDRNQGAVAAAEAVLAKARAERRAAERALRAELEQVLQELRAAREEAETVRSSLLPAARAAYEAIREGYQWGKFEILALLDAQRTLLEIRARLIDANAAYHLARVRLERLTAPLHSNEPNPGDTEIGS